LVTRSATISHSVKDLRRLNNAQIASETIALFKIKPRLLLKAKRKRRLLKEFRGMRGNSCRREGVRRAGPAFGLALPDAICRVALASA
jgi:hypothetical protein